MKNKTIFNKLFPVLLTSISLLGMSCNIFFPKKEDKSLLALASIYKYQRPFGVYISGKLIDANNNPLVNATVTIAGRGEDSAQVKIASGTGTNGFYAGVISQTPSGPNSISSQYATAPTYSNATGGNPATFIGKFNDNPATTAVTTLCSSIVRTAAASYPTANPWFTPTITRADNGNTNQGRRVVCDTTILDPGAASVGINTNLQPSGTVVASFTTDSAGRFYSSFIVPTVGNTYTVSVSGISKTRRLRINNAGTGGLLRSFCPNISTSGCPSTFSLLIDSANSDLLPSTGQVETNEGYLDAVNDSAKVGFNVDSLVIELEYPRNLISLEGTLNQSETIPSGFNVLLNGTVVVPNGITLTISPGVTIYGSTSPGGALLVKPGGKLIATGTANAPIVFTSEKGLGLRQPGDWQGVILQGNGCQTFGGRCAIAVGEGDVGTFGGSDNTGSCGTLEYVRIEFAGAPFSPGNERNGLSLMGCGSGTSIQYVQVHKSYDDAFEIWGGAPQFKYVIASLARDDHFDFADGTLMKMQYGIALLDADSIRSNDDISRCIEGDGNTEQKCNGSARSGLTCADPYFANITCAGPSSATNLGDSIFVRRSSDNKTGDYGNFLIDGLARYANCSTASATGGFIKGIYGINGQSVSSCGNPAPTINPGSTIVSKSPTSPDFSPSSSNTGITSLKSSNTNFNDPFFDDTTFYGAVQFGGTRWWDGWTSFPAN